MSGFVTPNFEFIQKIYQEYIRSGPNPNLASSIPSMALFRVLHITDVHMTSNEGAKPSADYSKAPGLVSHSLMRTKVDDVRDSFRHLSKKIASGGAKIDLIIHSGDVNNGQDDDGLESFEDFLRILKSGDALADNCQVLVVPGNHDVNRGKMDTEDYYRPFLPRPTCGIPIIESFAYSADDPAIPYFLNSEHGLLVVPINSSRFSGGTLEIPSKKPQLKPGDQTWLNKWLLSKIEDKIELPGEMHVDAPRIGLDQFAYLNKILIDAEKEYRNHADEVKPLLKIAVLHHHLLPVSLIEETKPFESIIDLAALRHFLREHDFKLVLHGHKHQFLRYRDQIPDITKPWAPYHQVSIISGPPLVDARPNDPAFLVLDFDTSSAAPHVLVTPWKLAHSTAKAEPLPRDSSIERLYSINSFGEISQSNPVVLIGSASNVHARAADLLTYNLSDSGNGIDQIKIPNLICQVDGPLDEGELAELFETQRLSLSNSATRDAEAKARFREIVDWWQLKDFGPSFARRFNHGTRIRNFNEDDLNQMSLAIQTLKSDLGSTKSIITLVNPLTDLKSDGPFPSFCLLHFIARVTPGKTYLDCVAYFRKQEMLQWWLVNLAEIDRLRDELMKGLGSRQAIAVGKITTISGLAVASRSPLQVSIPKADRLMTSAKGKAQISRHVVLLGSNDAERRRESADYLKSLLADLQPPIEFDPDGAPVSGPGIEFIRAIVNEMIDDSGLGVNWSQLKLHLAEIERRTYEYAKNPSDQTEFDNWSEAVSNALAKLTDLLDGISGENAS